MIVCVLGAGTMGSGIAQVAAQSGHNTIIFDMQAEALGKARLAIDKSLQSLVNRQKITTEDKAAIADRIQYTNDINHCIADIAIEAIVEKIEAKTALFNQLAALNHDRVIFATNTSSLSVSGIQEKIQHPGRVVGMHFFNPAPVMKLVEVVKGRQTTGETVEQVVEITRQMGKIPVICKDAPGFIVNRVARPYYLEAMRLVEKEAVTPEQVDAIMQATGFKMGPFTLMDLIGIDINYAVSCSVYDQMNHPPRLQPSVLQQQKIEEGKLGRKTGEGFYTYK